MSEAEFGTDTVLFTPIFVILVNKSWSFCVPELPSVIMIQSGRCNFQFSKRSYLCTGKRLELQRNPQPEETPMYSIYILQLNSGNGEKENWVLMAIVNTSRTCKVSCFPATSSWMWITGRYNPVFPAPCLVTFLKNGKWEESAGGISTSGSPFIHQRNAFSNLI